MIGVDVVEISRFRRALDLVPRIEARLFTPAERSFCRSSFDPPTRFAGTFAAKEAVVKALGLSSIHQWAQRIEVVRAGSGRPTVLIDGNETPAMVSISHEGSVAVAIALRAD
ncbi:MAG TPA: holo-ACP synthase [Actinomycetota bacterium]|nr:holo-ACP synthase [Actinomycetota bacterium]